jgi:EF-P beta-lysylation protein EpmB
MVRSDVMESVAFQSEFMEAPSGPAEWQKELTHAVRDPAEFCRLAGLSSSAAEAAVQAADGFPIMVPRPYLARIRPGDAADPLLLQVLPRMAEFDHIPGFIPDPLDENNALCGPGLLWKYQNRILILTTPLCAVHCRFCFRRHFPFKKDTVSLPKWGEILEFLNNHSSIHEVILSGGDPLLLPDDLLSDLSAKLAQIPHVRRLRLHTRLPIVIPHRVCNELISWLKGTRLTTIIVVHINHPREIDSRVAASLGRLIDEGIPVLSQGVLLAGINDNLEALAELYERLADLRVQPYYLHQLDPVAGAAHFEVPIARGKTLIAGLRARLPVYAVPRYVQEVCGGNAKDILA